MKSTQKIHDITERMPVEDRKQMMAELLDLRLTILNEIAGTTNNGMKLLRLFYKGKCCD